jgi:hypothetical protein
MANERALRRSSETLYSSSYSRARRNAACRFAFCFFPTRLFVLGSFVDRLALGFDGACLGLMHLLGFIEGRLSLRDRILPALAFPLSGRFFP